ncbi:hypothetical protein P3W85_17630 [Cupriavidus basilensis]|uniref:Uncharacterized protein n=1 Tax=Cupriavidus basilensis TaxID=68895 RepID=A0ABT6AQ63_9BURK|nr:hypothetical protein [Cupriavidus basilensis]MDF3834765.1 hypothetical protein [Cupriavidus basilensis]
MAISLHCIQSGAGQGSNYASLAATMAWLAHLAIPLDGSGKAILQMLGGRTAYPWRVLSSVCTLAKLAAILLGLAFIVADGPYRFLPRIWHA